VLRSVVGTAAIALVAALGLPGPATAVPGRYTDPLASLPEHPEWGSITGVDGKLRRGCHPYSYSYALTPPDGVWAIEVYITGPGLKPLAGGAFLDGYDPEAGPGSYKLCRNTTRPGTFTIQAKLSVDDGYGHITEGKLPADTFVLKKQKRRHHHR
jgi:hypothetical protein